MTTIKTLAGIALIAAVGLAAACGGGAANTNKPANAANTNANKPANAPANNSAASNSSNSASNSTATATDKDKKQDFTLVNKTGVIIDKLYISPHGTDDWEEDILGQDQLADGDTLDIKFHRSNTDAMWDMRIQDTKGNAIEWENLNLLKIKKITLHYDGKKATAETE